jgi:hypothetical protein
MLVGKTLTTCYYDLLILSFYSQYVIYLFRFLLHQFYDCSLREKKIKNIFFRTLAQFFCVCLFVRLFKRRHVILGRRHHTHRRPRYLGTLALSSIRYSFGTLVEQFLEVVEHILEIPNGNGFYLLDDNTIVQGRQTDACEIQETNHQ